jgi:hypothetical protein
MSLIDCNCEDVPMNPEPIIISVVNPVYMTIWARNIE